MPSHYESKILPYSAKQMLDLVLDIENYPQFLPWCSAAKITNRISDTHLHADLVIHFKSFFQKYSSDVKIIKITEGEYKLEATSINGPFKKLVNNWHFRDLGSDSKPSVAVEFFIDFEFQSFILEKMIGLIFEKATKKMIDAFEKRAEELYKNN